MDILRRLGDFLAVDLLHVCRVYGALFSVGVRQLLMASGIGDKAELEAHGLDCIADVPELGKNLQVKVDHVRL